jgi:hypothetical protein
MLPVWSSLLQILYLDFHPLKGSGLFATLIINVSCGSRFAILVLLPAPLSAITKMLDAILL